MNTGNLGAERRKVGCVKRDQLPDRVTSSRADQSMPKRDAVLPFTRTQALSEVEPSGMTISGEA